MSPNKEVFIFLTILSIFGNFFSIYIKRVFAFLYYTASFILVIAIAFCQSNLFWDRGNGFVNTFSVHNDFNATNNCIRFLNFTYSFVEANFDVSENGHCNVNESIKKEVMVVLRMLS